MSYDHTVEDIKEAAWCRRKETDMTTDHDNLREALRYVASQTIPGWQWRAIIEAAASKLPALRPEPRWSVRAGGACVDFDEVGEAFMWARGEATLGRNPVTISRVPA